MAMGIDGWMTTLSSLGGAVFNNIAAFGGFLARIQGITFAAAPWFFVAGFSVGTLYQFAMASLNALRAYESPADSTQRQHYFQAASYNLMMTLQLASCVTAIVLFNLFPANTLLITAFALTVVTINVGSCIWRFLSSETKKEIKKELGFGKPEQETNPEQVVVLDKIALNEVAPPQHTRLFTTCDHSEVIKKMNHEDSQKYLRIYITRKLSVLVKNGNNEKNQQKIEVLQLLEQVLIKNTSMPDQGKIHKKYPRLVDNFWCEKSDTLQLLDAVGHYCKNDQDLHRQVQARPGL